MKRLLLVAAVALMLPLVAEARDWSGFGALVQAQGQPPDRKAPGPDWRDERDRQQGAQDKGHRGRLTQEERRDLHRDLDRANREIYRRR